MKNKILHLIKAPTRALRRLYDWTIHWSRTKKAPYALFGVAFIESSFFPVPPDVLLIAMVIAHPKKWISYSFICTAGSLLGALLGYFIGWAFFELVGQFIVNTYHLQATVEMIGTKYQQNAFITIFVAAFTPVPYKAITISAGLFRISLGTLLIASLIGRAGRFFAVAGALKVSGKKIADSIEKYFDILSLIFVALLVAGFLYLKLSCRQN